MYRLARSFYMQGLVYSLRKFPTNFAKISNEFCKFREHLNEFCEFRDIFKRISRILQKYLYENFRVNERNIVDF